MNLIKLRPIVVCLLAVLPLAAPAAESGSLVGVVRTVDGTPLVQVVLTLSGRVGSLRLVTGPEGRYRVAELAPGEYALAVDVPGLVLRAPARTVVAAGETRLDLTLVPAPVSEHVVVTATRGEAAASGLGVTASVLDAERIDERAASSFLEVLRDVPGLAVARAGGIGLQASAFVRGGENRFARVLVDGVPMNEPGGYFNLGSQLPLELARVEVVRGAASSLYGTDALAGVVHLVTRRPDVDARPGVHLALEAGSFAWWQGEAGTSGRKGPLDWNLGLLRLTTDNEQPNSAFAETAGAASLGARLGARTSARLILRGESSTVGTPGPTAFGRPDLDARYERGLLALGARLHHARERVVHELRLGLAQTDQLSLDPLDSGSFLPAYGGHVAAFPYSDFPDPSGFQNDTRRLALGYQAALQAGARNLVTLGAELERETGAIGSRPEVSLSPERTNVGAYVQDRVVLGDRAHLTLGGRVERNASYGTRAVPRAALAVRARRGANATTLKASAGAGIKEPSFLESFGVSFYAQGNPGLRPERSRTFDLGLEQRLADGRLRAEATLFHHDYYDQIAYHVLDESTFQGTFLNLGKTRARGVELAFEAVPTPALRLSAQYTYLDGTVLVSGGGFDPVYAPGRALLRRPKHQGSLDAQAGRGRVGAGATLVLVGRRADSDFVGLGFEESPGYARLDARLRLRVARGVEAFVVGENVLDRRYQDVLGYPALGRSLRAGLRFRSGASSRP